jgi:hypothetical protein
MTGESGYVKSTNKRGIKVVSHLEDAGRFTQAQADEIIATLKTYVATHAYTVSG